MGALCCIGVGLMVYWWVKKLFSGPEKPDESNIIELTITPPARSGLDETPDFRSEAVVRSKRAFSVYDDARTVLGRFDGSHHSFSSSRIASETPKIVTGLTFELDRLYVLRGEGVSIYPYATTLTVAIVNGRPAGFQEHAVFSMLLTEEGQEESARFPLSFPGWLEIVDSARRSGATIEMDEDLPAQLQALIEQPLPGDEHYDPVRVRSKGASGAVARPAKCPSCGANLAGQDVCAYCDSRVS